MLRVIYGLLRVITMYLWQKLHFLVRVTTDKYEQVMGILRAFYGLLRVYYGMLRFIEAFTCKLRPVYVLLRIVTSFTSPYFLGKMFAILNVSSFDN